MGGVTAVRASWALLGLASLALGRAPTASGTGPNQEPFLVADINTSQAPDAGSDPHSWRTVGDTTYFAAEHFESGIELWKTVGGAAPELVRDIAPLGDSAPDDLASAGGRLFFTAFTEETGRELWTSDGTEAGTFLLADISPGAPTSDPDGVIGLGGRVLFSAWAPGLGRELWVSDGTSAGTMLVTDLSPGSDWSNPQFLTELNGRVYFAADDGIVGRELWSSDGTAAGTTLVADLLAVGSSTPRNLHAVAGRVWFAADSAAGVEPWTSDGTVTALLADVSPGASSSDPAEFVESGGSVFFNATGPLGRELWISDGTGPGTTPVDLTAGAASTSPVFLTPVDGGVVLFSLENNDVWFSDGTVGGSTLLLPSAGTTGIVALGGRAVVQYGSTFAPSLYATDGTVGGTELLLENTTPGSLYSDGATAWVAHPHTAGAEPWITDATPAGTQQLADVNPGATTEGSLPHELVAWRDEVYFIAWDGTSTDVWVSDGTASGTRLAAPGAGWNGAESLVATESHVFLLDDDDIGWVVNGPTPGEGPLGWVNPYYKMVEYDGHVYFTRGNEMWRTDGTVAGTELFFDPPTALLHPTGAIEPFAGHLFFSAFADGHGREIWWTDGTPAGTEMFVEMGPGWTGVIGGNPRSAVANGKLFIGTTEGFWCTDGTPAGSQLLNDDTSLDYLVRVPGGVFYHQGSSIPPVWSDGTVAGTFPVPGAPGVSVDKFVTSGSTLFFVESGAERDLWKVEAPPVAAEVLADLEHYVESHDGLWPVTSDGRILFPYDQEPNGDEVWISDGTPGGTGLFADLSATEGSEPSEFVRAGEYVFFAAGNDSTLFGRELYALRVLDTGGWVVEPFGTGCAGSSGVPPEAHSTTPAALGELFSVQLRDALPGSVALLLYSFGTLDIPLGACTLHLDLPFLTAAVVPTDPSGDAAFTFPLPASWALVGTPIYLQYLVADPGGAFEGVASFSNGLEVVAGP